MENDKQVLSGKRLREEREKRLCLTEKELGKKIHYDATTISKYENGKLPLSREALSRLCVVFGVRPQYLLAKDDFRTQLDLDDYKYQMMKKEIETNSAALKYLSAIGLSLRPCYVWNTSKYAAAMGYQIMKPYLVSDSCLSRSVIVNIVNGKACTESDIGSEFLKFSQNIDYVSAVNNEYYFPRLLDELAELNAFSLDAEISIQDLKNERLGIFEFAGNPIENADFRHAYDESINMYMAMFRHDDVKSNSDPLESSAGFMKQGEIPLTYFYDSRQFNHGDLDLNGFLAGSSLEFRYAFSENGTLKNYVSLADIRRMVTTINSAAISIAGALLK